jgi:phytoene dehydrogenase-like protein
MGTVSFILADIARDLGVTLAAGAPVARILPGAGVELAGGETIHAPVVIANADPCTTLRLLDGAADAGWRAQVEATPQRLHGQGDAGAARRHLPGPDSTDMPWGRSTRP